MTQQIQAYSCDINLLRSLLWEDNEAVNLQALIQNKQNWMQLNHCDFWEGWIRNVFDLNTANEDGLRVWSEILGIRLFSTIEVSPGNYPAFGFNANGENFNNGNFATDTNATFLLSTEQKRTVLKLRFYQLVSRGAIPEINRFLTSAFPDLGVYALDGNDMTITYVNTERLEPELRRVIIDLDLLPRPAGVGIRFIDASLQSWGFGSNDQNFDNGNFIGGQNG